ncbi:hypothetical protein DFH27DRAFT_569754 [Peziza echinospora]|nr:hypothetical protein DFH27DRAFT_569754 [Peziza echinospora]
MALMCCLLQVIFFFSNPSIPTSSPNQSIHCSRGNHPISHSHFMHAAFTWVFRGSIPAALILLNVWVRFFS